MKPLRFRTTPDQQRLLLMRAMACGIGMVVAWLLWPVDTEALDALRLEVAQLQTEVHAQLHAPLQVPQRQAAQSAPAGSTAQKVLMPHEPHEPDLAESVRVWPWLQQRLRAQGLQVQVLRPQAVATSSPLPQQGVAMRLQGRWRDWLDFEAAMHSHAPWWVIDQWQVVPVGPQSDEVRIELQARLGFRPPALQDKRPPRVWPEWPVVAGGQPTPGADLFARLPMSGGTPLVSEAPSPLPSDPRGWPVQALRLLGVWQQAGTAHAVLGDGLNQVVVTQGQRIGREAYRVRWIGDDQVELGATTATALVLRLTLQGDKP